MHHVISEDHVSMVGSGKIHAIHSRNEVTFCDRSEKIEGHRFSQTAEYEFRTFLDTLSAI